MAQKIKTLKKPGKGDAARLKKRIRYLEKNLFYLWEYICTEGFTEEAREYLMENADKSVPFDFE